MAAAPPEAGIAGGAESAVLAGYLDACATTPPAAEVLLAMAEAERHAWANPSSLHAAGLAAAECLERSRWRVAGLLGCQPEELIFCSGGTEAIHTAVLGMAAGLEPGRLVVSSVEHPATLAAADQLSRRGWQLARLPVDHHGLVRLEDLEAVLEPPTRLASIIWGQSEVGSIQPIQAIGERCRAAGVPLHVDAVQMVGHLPVSFSSLPIDLLSCASHKLQGPRGIGALLVRRGVCLTPLIGGVQEGGRRGGTEAVVLAAGFARALELATQRRSTAGEGNPMAGLRNRLWQDLRQLEGVRLSGPDPFDAARRLPHHLSLLISSGDGTPLSGRALVQALSQEGFAVSSGSACSSGLTGSGQGGAPSPILLAMGFGPQQAASGLRISLGPWLREQDLTRFPEAFERARRHLRCPRPGG